MIDATKEGALAPYRLLEMPGIQTVLCGKIFSDLGADVIKAEPARGDPCRGLEPFFEDSQGRQASLFWRAYNRGKRGITMNLTRGEGRELFEKLILKMDFLVEGYPPGYLDDLGLGFEQLRLLNPKLIMVSITPFGQTGPYKDYRGPDIIPLALGGYMHMCGDKEHPPVRVSLPQAYHHASGAGAVGAMMAHFQRLKTGRGQHVDVSAQHTYLAIAAQPYAFRDVEGVTLNRQGSSRDRGYKAPVRVVYPCRDGYVVWLHMTGPLGGPSALQLLERMNREGFGSHLLNSLDWMEDTFPKMSRQEIIEAMDCFGAYFLSKTKEEMFRMALEINLTMAPVYSVEDICHDEQMRARDFFETPEGEEPRLSYPGPAIRMSETPVDQGALAPQIGQHNEQIYLEELGLSRQEMERLRGLEAI